LALIEGAWRAVPSIEELPIAEMWVGFRPGSRDYYDRAAKIPLQNSSED
jgi:hypothetical protein